MNLQPLLVLSVMSWLIGKCERAHNFNDPLIKPKGVKGEKQGGLKRQKNERERESEEKKKIMIKGIQIIINQTFGQIASFQLQPL